MKLYLPCMVCHNSEPRPDSISHPVAVNEDGVYTMTCRNGHTTSATVEAHKYEILYEAGANAILDGYHREAITSFAASLERFYEHYIRVISRKHGISGTAFETMWKLVAKQSERQMGFFIAMHALEGGSPPAVLPQKYVELRNDATHKGLIPTREKAEEFAQAVMDIIKPLQQFLRDEPAAFDIFFERVTARDAKYGSSMGPTFLPSLIIRRTRDEVQEPEFRMLLAELDQRRQYLT